MINNKKIKQQAPLCSFAHTDTAEGIAIAVSVIISCFELNIFPPATNTMIVNVEIIAKTIINSTKEKPCCFIFLLFIIFPLIFIIKLNISHLMMGHAQNYIEGT
jgi:hypothetical protein